MDEQGSITITVDFTVSGHKSSEGDGRTAADIREELATERRVAEHVGGGHEEDEDPWGSTPPA